jgi:acetoin utilization deacetylase AcuC-like enzyme
LTLFFNSNLNVKENDSPSPSAGKPEEFFIHTQKYNLPVIYNFDFFTNEDFYIAHKKEHVDAIFNLEKDNGFGNRQSDIAMSLRYTNCAFYEAAKYSLKNNKTNVTPVCGFHHAGYDYSGGYCSFNGLMIAAMKMKQEGLVNYVGILDLDAHWGDGTHDIIKHFNIDYVKHISFRDICNFKNDVWEERLRDVYLPKFLNPKVDVIFYQAGADPHIDDPHGGYMTTEELALRDRIVFEFCRDNNTPLALTLAGGYQKPFSKVLEIHENTVKEYFKVFSS